MADAYADVVNQAGSSAKLELRKRFHDSYPFHPDLMDIINNRLSDNPNFQQVRGTLRLLSATIDLQQTNNTRDAILHPYHVDPRESRIREQFVNRLERRELAAGINADIDGDRNQGIEGAHEAAVTIMLGSVAQSANRGLTEQEGGRFPDFTAATRQGIGRKCHQARCRYRPICQPRAWTRPLVLERAQSAQDGRRPAAGIAQ